MGEEKGDDGTTESLDISPTGCRTFIVTISCLDPVLIRGLASLPKYFHRPSKILMSKIKLYYFHWPNAHSHVLSVQTLEANKAVCNRYYNLNKLIFFLSFFYRISKVIYLLYFLFFCRMNQLI